MVAKRERKSVCLLESVWVGLCRGNLSTVVEEGKGKGKEKDKER